MTHTCTGSHLKCRLWKNCLSGVDKLNKLLGSDHSGVCAPKEKLELSYLSPLFGPSAALTSRSKDSTLRFCVKMKRTFFWHWRNEYIMLWILCDTKWEGQLIDCCWKPGCVENDTLYSLLPYYLTFSTLHSSVKGWQSQQLPPWVRTSPFKEHLVFRSVTKNSYEMWSMYSI